MIEHFCYTCNRTRTFEFVREMVDDFGRVWEIYQCCDCGNQIRFAVT